MAERPGRWELLDHPSDPIVADTSAIESQLAHFRELAEMMRVEGQRLAKIGAGEALRGAYADELRSSSSEVAKDLDQVVGRYDAVVAALVEYQPAVQTALTRSALALDEAIDASGAQSTAESMPLATAEAGTSLSSSQEQANADREAAEAGASARLLAAQAKLGGVLDELDAAGQRAASVVRGGFKDGLTDSGWDRFKYHFAKFLKIFVEVLAIIGMVLAVIAVIIPGIGPALTAALMTAATVLEAAVLVAEVALVAMGESSWLDIGLAIASFVTFGGAKAIGTVVKKAARPAPSTPPVPSPAPSVAPSPVPSPVPLPAPSPAPSVSPAPAPASTPPPPEVHPPTPEATPAPPPAAGPWRPGATRNGWREREQAKREAAEREGKPVADSNEGLDDVMKADATLKQAAHDAPYDFMQYSGGGANELNTYQRKLHAGEVDPDKDLDKKISDLDALLASRVPVSDEIITFRSITGDHATNLRPGDTYSDAAYLSTSEKQGIADHFVTKEEDVFQGTRFTVTSKGMGFDMAKESGQNEAEVVFKHGEEFEVTSIQEAERLLSDDGLRRIQMWDVHMKGPIASKTPSTRAGETP